MCGSPAVHAGDGLPAVPARTELLPRLKAHRPIVAADAVEEAVHGGHTAAGPPAGHGLDRDPLAHPGVQPLHTGLVVVGVKPAQGVDTVVQDGDPAVSSPGVHGGAGGPDTGQRVVPLHRGETRGPVVAAAAVNQAVQGAGSEAGPLGAHWCYVCPLVRGSYTELWSGHSYLVDLRIETFCSGQVIRSIKSSHCVKHISHCGHSCSGSPGVHTRDKRPPVGPRVIHFALRMDCE